jgi:hypothetical protein
MKKTLFFTLILAMFAFVGYSQRSYTVATIAIDTLTDAETAYAYVYKTGTTKQDFTGSWYVSAQAYVDHLTGSTDSTQVSWEGSNDGTYWIPLGYAATGTAVASASLQTSWSTITWLTTDDAIAWAPTTQFRMLYLRAKIQHYATGTVTYAITARIYQ